ncbi:hypothetical protein FQR65_LT15676 [Abscondita terminalis]|nr:hypothetical protein FQR65_LT15676 [Abscondita terminalis]
MFKPLCLVLFAILNFSVGQDLICHTCVGTLPGDCYNGVEAFYHNGTCTPVPDANALPFKGFNLKSLKRDESVDRMCIIVVVNGMTVQFFGRSNQEVLFLDPGIKAVYRGCAYMNEGVDMCEFLSSTMDVGYCHICKTDLCNGQPVKKL